MVNSKYMLFPALLIPALLALALALLLPRPGTTLALAPGSTPQASRPATVVLPYIFYLPVVFRNHTVVVPMQTITVPVGIKYNTESALRLISFGHTFAEAADPSGNHVCTSCERYDALLAGQVYEADYGTWYYVYRSFTFVNIPLIPGRIVSATLRVDLCNSAYQYSGPPPVLRLHPGTWPGPGLPADLRLLWRSWDQDAVLGEYAPSSTVSFEDCANPANREQVSIPLDTRYIRPGETLKIVWRLRDDNVNLVSSAGQTARLVDVFTGAYRYTSSKYHAELEIRYLP